MFKENFDLKGLINPSIPTGSASDLSKDPDPTNRPGSATLPKSLFSLYGHGEDGLIWHQKLS